MPAYHFGAGRLDGDLGRADVRVDDLAGVPFVQAGGASGAAGARPVEPEPDELNSQRIFRALPSPEEHRSDFKTRREEEMIRFPVCSGCGAAR